MRHIIRFAFITFCTTIFLCKGGFSQEFREFSVGSKVKENNRNYSYLNPTTNKIYINLVSDLKFYRYELDTNFKILRSYETMALNRSYNPQAAVNEVEFQCEFFYGEDTYEVYSDRDEVIVYKLDFTNKTDSISFERKFVEKGSQKRIIALMPAGGKLRILVYSAKLDILTLFTWTPGSELTEINFNVPEHNLSREEEKKFSRNARVKYKTQFPLCVVNNISGAAFAVPSTVKLFYNDSVIYITFLIPHHLGVNIIEINMDTGQLKNNNVFVNADHPNPTQDYFKYKRPVITIHEDLLIVENSSYTVYEYRFYDLKTLNLLKKHNAVIKDSMDKLIHSNIVQKGTYISKREQKELDNEKSFMRKKIQGSEMIFVNPSVSDSLIITTASLQVTTGIEGTLLVFASGAAFYMAAPGSNGALILIGINRNKLIYAHSKFSLKDLEPSKNKNVSTMLDRLLNDHDIKDLHKKSTFFLRNNKSYYIGLLHSSGDKYIVRKYPIEEN